MDTRKYLAELIGTFILVIIGSMSIVAARAMNAPILVVVPFGFGLGLLAAIQSVGYVSGGHFNPAVTVGLWAGGRFASRDVVPYIVAQVVGAIVASFALYIIAIAAAFWYQAISHTIYIAVAIMWLVPDPRIERRLERG